MSQFTEPLELAPSPDGSAWVTTRNVVFELGCEGSGLTVTVPTGTETDLATVPRILWPLFRPHSPRYAAAYVLHDFLCEWEDFDVVTADAVLFDALRALGASWAYSTCVLWAVRTYHFFTMAGAA